MSSAIPKYADHVLIIFGKRKEKLHGQSSQESPESLLEILGFLAGYLGSMLEIFQFTHTVKKIPIFHFLY